MSRQLGAAVLLLILAGCSASASPSVVPSAASTAPRASAAATAGATQPVEGVQLPDAGCCVGFALEPGRYAGASFVPFWVSIEVGEGWRGLRNGTERIVAFVQGSNAIQHPTHYMALFGVDRDEAVSFLGQFQATDLLTVSSSEPIEIGGLTGTRVDAVADPNPGELGTEKRVAGSIPIPAMTALTNPATRWFTESAEAGLQIYLLEATDTHTLIVYVEAPSAEFDAFSATVADALATLQVAPR